MRALNFPSFFDELWEQTFNFIHTHNYTPRFGSAYLLGRGVAVTAIRNMTACEGPHKISTALMNLFEPEKFYLLTSLGRPKDIDVLASGLPLLLRPVRANSKVNRLQTRLEMGKSEPRWMSAIFRAGALNMAPATVRLRKTLVTVGQGERVGRETESETDSWTEDPSPAVSTDESENNPDPGTDYE